MERNSPIAAPSRGELAGSEDDRGASVASVRLTVSMSVILGAVRSIGEGSIVLVGLEGLNSSEAGAWKSFMLLGSGASCESGTAGPLEISSLDMPRMTGLRALALGVVSLAPNGEVELVLDRGWVALLCVIVVLVLTCRA